MARANLRTAVLILLATMFLPAQIATAQDFGDPAEVDSDGLQPIDLEPIPHASPVASVAFDLDGDGVLEILTFSTPIGVPVVYHLPALPGTFPTPTKTLSSQLGTGASLPITIRSSTPLAGLTFDLIDPQYPTPEVLAGLTGLDLGTSTLGQIVEALDAANDPRGTVIRAFDDLDRPVPLAFRVVDYDPTRPIGSGVSLVTDLSAEGGPVTVLSIPGDGNRNDFFSEDLTLTVLRVSVAAAATPFSSITITGARPGTDGVPGGGDYISIDNLEFTPVPAVTVVDIDIKPGSFPNSINPGSRGRIPVAILTTAGFDATTVDSTTVRFGATGTEAPAVSAALEDVDGDGDTDLVLHFDTQAAGLPCGTTSASVTGATTGDQAIEGADSIRTVGCK